MLIASTDWNYGNISPQPIAAADERISPDFRRIASENLGQLESLLPLRSQRTAPVPDALSSAPLPSYGQSWGNYPLIAGCSQPGTFTA